MKQIVCKVPSLRTKICIIMALVFSIVVTYAVMEQRRNASLGRIAQAAVLDALTKNASVPVNGAPDYQLSSEFLAFFPVAFTRAKVTYDPERTQSRWVCACAFTVQIHDRTVNAGPDQHHLSLDGKYYHLAWQGDDLGNLIGRSQSNGETRPAHE